MIVMLDTPDAFDECEKELGCQVEQLFTPLTRRDPQRPDAPFCCDNGAFGKSGFDVIGFEKMLAKHYDRRHLCRFVALPDVVGSARRTLECFEQWRDLLSGWPKALVAQDGIENLTIPWDSFDAIFIGGSTEWKQSRHAADVVRAGKICGKWVHIGRVNTPERFDRFAELGADSIDGTGIARYTWQRERMNPENRNPNLFAEALV